jgi:hypothetical protein
MTPPRLALEHDSAMDALQRASQGRCRDISYPARVAIINPAAGAPICYRLIHNCFQTWTSS